MSRKWSGSRTVAGVETWQPREGEPFFWMGGRLAYDLVEISNEPDDVHDGGFWAVSTTFEGEWVCAKFGHIVEAALPESASSWVALTNEWRSSLTRDQYLKYVQEIQREISLGWVYQVNACRELSAPYSGATMLPLMHLLLRHNPAPYSSYLRIPQLEIASASPELFLSRDQGALLSGPIKGTQKLGYSEGEFGEKDKAENIMIVDLIRNDLGEICETGSVHVPHLLERQDHPGLSHLVSYVSGSIRKDLPWSRISEAMLPPGSVSGAPKSSAVETIKRIETQRRGPYCGALGWIEGESALLSVAIRIFWDARDGHIRFGTGAGITWGSDPISEWEETELKAGNLMAIAQGKMSS